MTLTTPRPATDAPDSPLEVEAALNSSAPLTNQARSRMDVIDILRGTACLWVVLHHCLSGSQAAPGALDGLLAVLIAVSKIGWVGVNLFLVLSGFCLYYPLVRKMGVSGVRLDLKTYVRRRALRILPAYYAALAVGMGVIAFHNARHHLPLASGFPGWPVFALHLVMLFNLSPQSFGAYNGAFWSLALECQLYVVFPLLVWLAARRGVLLAIIGALCISVAAQLLTYTHFGILPNWPGNDNAAMGYTSLPSRVFEFVAGMAAASLVARPTTPQAKRAGAIALALLPFCLAYAARARFGPLLDSLWGAEFAALNRRGLRREVRRARSAKPAAARADLGGDDFLQHLPTAPLCRLDVLHRVLQRENRQCRSAGENRHGLRAGDLAGLSVPPLL